MSERVNKSDEAWRAELSPEQYAVCRQGGTEAPFSGGYWDEKRDGVYCCACCGEALFDARTKFESGTGWPSYFAPVGDGVIRELADDSHGMRRVEVRCARCDAHLGHVFPDGPAPSGNRYCINSVSLTLRDRPD